MTQELEIKIKLKIAVEVEAGSQNLPIVPAHAIDGTDDSNPVLVSKEEETQRKSKYKKPDRKFMMFFVPYIIGLLLFLLLLRLNIVDWKWEHKAAVFGASAAFAFLASLGKGLLTNWNDAAETYSQKSVDEGKSFCDGIAIVAGLIAILSVFSNTISSHDMSVKVEDLKKSQDATLGLVCNIYGGQNKPCDRSGTQPKH